IHCTLVGTSRRDVRERRSASFLHSFSSLRRRKSKTPRNPASVLPLPAGEVSKIECGSNAAGTQSNWACVNVANVSQNHRAKRGCKRANNWRGEAARTDRVTVFRGDSSPIRPLLEFSLLFIDAPGSPKRIRRVADACGLSFRIDLKVFILRSEEHTSEL